MTGQPSGRVDPTPVCYQFASFCLDVTGRRLLKNGAPQVVSARSFDVLVVLVERAGQPVPKRELLDRVWPDIFVDELNLAQHVSLLRKVLRDSSRSPQFIATIPRVGYQFVAPVESVSAAPVQEAAFSASRDGTERWRGALVPALALLLVLVTIAQEPGARRSTDPSAALAAADRGRELLVQYTPADARRSRVYFAGATALDPTDAVGWAGVATSVTAMYLARELTHDDAVVEARAAAERAVALAPRSSESREAMGAVLLQLVGDWPAAERELRDALALDPENEGALDLLARGLRQAGRFEESIDTARQALRVEESPRSYLNLATSLFFAGDDWGEAIDLCRRTLDLHTDSAVALMLLVDLYEATGQESLAIDVRAELEQARGRQALAEGLRDDFTRLGFDRAMQAFWPRKVDLLRASSPSPNIDFELVRAQIRASDLDGAFDTLDRMQGEGYNAGLLALKFHPMYGALQADPRFVELDEAVTTPAPGR